MPRKNRVLPTGEIAADPARGLFTGNRGCLHDETGRLGRARWRHMHWIICALDYKGIRRPLMQPGRWTELFFLDEAAALSAGHRPCALCRRPAFRAFQAAWEGAGLGTATAPEMDRALHAARLCPDGSQRRFEAPVAGLPDCTFILLGSGPAMILAGQLHPFGPGGYGAPLLRPTRGEVTVLTPHPAVAALAAGFRPVTHPTAGRT